MGEKPDLAHASLVARDMQSQWRQSGFLIAGYSYDPDCMYVNGTGRDYYEFFIQLNRCGTLGENTHHQDSRKNPTVGERGESREQERA